MYTYLVILSLSQIVFAARLRVPPASYNHTYTNPETSLKFSSDQKIIQMINISDVYDLDVAKLDNGQVSQVIETPYISLDNEYLDEFKIENECIGLPKHPKLIEVFEHEILEQTEDLFYNDILSIPQKEEVFLITDNLILMQGTLNRNGSKWQFSLRNNTIKLEENISDYANAQFICFQEQCLIVTNLGGYSLNVAGDLDINQNIVTKLPEIIIRSEFQTLHAFEKYVAVAVGSSGVDLYEFNGDGTVKHTYTLGVSDFRVSQINIISLKFQWGRLSVLDEYNGLFIFDFHQDQRPQLLLNIPIPRSVAFDHYSDTYLVVAETPNNIEQILIQILLNRYMMEIFVSVSKQEYYVNRVYVDDFSFKDIEINQHYAIVIGEDVHMVIRHSVFNGFLKNNKELIKTFFQNELVRFEHYNITTSEQDTPKFHEISSYIGLSRGSIHVWRLLEYNSVLICQFNHRSEGTYQIRANSTICPNTTLPDLYEQCQTTQLIQVSVQGPLIESDKIPLIIGLSVGGGLILLILAVILCRKGRNMWKRVRELRQQYDEMKKYGQFQEVEQQSIVH